VRAETFPPATDAYAFLIEAEGKRLLYSGDLRSHGRKGQLFDNLIQRPIRKSIFTSSKAPCCIVDRMGGMIAVSSTQSRSLCCCRQCLR
jgi:hypothetical protein